MIAAALKWLGTGLLHFGVVLVAASVLAMLLTYPALILFLILCLLAAKGS